MAEEIGFDFKLYQVQDEKWGSKNEHGEWNGLIKDMMDGEADVGAYLLITQGRSEVIDFMLPFYADKYGFFISTKASYTWSTYFQPFLYESWIVLLFMLFLISITFAMVARVGKDKNIKEFTLEKCMIYVFGAYAGLAIRRWSVTPVNISAR